MKKLAIILALSLNLQACAVAVVAGAAGAVASAHDNRTLGAQVEDNEIELKFAHSLSKETKLDQKIRVSAISYNRNLLLVGQAPSQHLKNQAEDIGYSIVGVDNVYNEIRIAPQINLEKITNDTWLTSKVKANLLAAKHFDGSNIKVVTENSEVFLMGIVNKYEAKEALKTTSKINGVGIVSDVFEAHKK